jgi:hypothetical protein
VNTVDNLRIVGRATSPGLVIGPAFVYHIRIEALSAPRSISRHEIDEELGHVERAVETVRDDLQVSARRRAAARTQRQGSSPPDFVASGVRP